MRTCSSGFSWRAHALQTVASEMAITSSSCMHAGVYVQGIDAVFNVASTLAR